MLYTLEYSQVVGSFFCTLHYGIDFARIVSEMAEDVDLLHFLVRSLM